jgi:ABC-type branched-subunit amino acid transport system ATPase component
MLRIEHLSKSFGGLQALEDVSIEAPLGHVTGLIGPNGSGKSTLFDTATGVVPMDHGHIEFDGKPVKTPRLDIMARRGVLRTFQVPRVAAGLTVLEHLMLAPTSGSSESYLELLAPWAVRRLREDRSRRLEAAQEMAATLGLRKVRNDLAGSLSGGQLKLLTLGVVLMVRPRMLLLDEPLAGVNERVIEVIVQLLRRQCAEGTGILLIEHNMSVMWEACSTIYAMSQGRIIAHGHPQEVRRDPLVGSAYLGRGA